MPIFLKENEIFIFNQNFFYQNWNKIYKVDLVEFILPLENIEIIKKINDNKKNLINLEIDELFQEYSKKNSALLLIERNENGSKKIYIKAKIQGKNISKGFDIKKPNPDTKKNNREIIIMLKDELINLVKSKNLIDIRTPSFLNVKLNLNKKSNLVELNSRIKNIDLIENVFVQEFNKDFMILRIKYLGKLNKIINQLEKENVKINYVNEQWVIKTL